MTLYIILLIVGILILLFGKTANPMWDILGFFLIIISFIGVVVDKEPELNIIHVSSYNEMIPEQYIDDYQIIVKQGDLIRELKYDVVTNELTEISKYNVKNN